MNSKKIIFTFATIILFIIFSCSMCFAKDITNMAKNSAEDVKNTTESAMNGVKNFAVDTGKDIKTGTETAGNNIKNTTEKASKDIKNGSEYTAERTDATIMGMTENNWTWIIIGVSAIAIIAIIWYYVAKITTTNNDNHHFDEDDKE